MRVIRDRAQLLQELPQRLIPTSEVLLEDLSLLAHSAFGKGRPLPTARQLKNTLAAKSFSRPNRCKPAYLVLTDTYFPGWIAQIDGEDTPIYRADGNFRAVVVPGGRAYRALQVFADFVPRRVGPVALGGDCGAARAGRAGLAEVCASRRTRTRVPGADGGKKFARADGRIAVDSGDQLCAGAGRPARSGSGKQRQLCVCGHRLVLFERDHRIWVGDSGDA